MCLRVLVRVHACAHARLHACVRACVRAHICMFMYVCVSKCMCVCARAYLCVCGRAYVRARENVHERVQMLRRAQTKDLKLQHDANVVRIVDNTDGTYTCVCTGAGECASGRVCERACVRVCMRLCVCAFVRACVHSCD